MTIVGIDVSSKRVDLAWLENGKPQRWHQQLDEKAHLIDRLRSIRIQWPGVPFTVSGDHMTVNRPGHEVTDIAIEYPWARGNGVAALWSTVGVITRQAPHWARVSWPYSKDLRAAIGSVDIKGQAHLALSLLCVETGWDLSDWTPDELDALVTCVGWTRILEAQDAA